jgi:hypothetical protein
MSCIATAITTSEARPAKPTTGAGEGFRVSESTDNIVSLLSTAPVVGETETEEEVTSSRLRAAPKEPHQALLHLEGAGVRPSLCESRSDSHFSKRAQKQL